MNDSKRALYQSGNIKLYKKLDRPPIKWLVKDLIKEGAISVLYGSSGCMKSYASVDLACRIENGLDFHGRELNQGKVIYIAAEAAEETDERIEAWQKFHNKAERPYIFDQSIALHNKTDMDNLKSLVIAVEKQEGRVPLVVIDGLSDCAAGVKLSDPDDVNARLKPHLISFTRDTGVGLFILHHTGHNNDHERGAKALRDMADTTIKATKKTNMFDVTWKPEKIRRLNPDKWVNVDLHIEDVSDIVDMDDMAIIQGGKWKSEVTESQAEQKMNPLVEYMVEHGLAEEDRRTIAKALDMWRKDKSCASSMFDSHEYKAIEEGLLTREDRTLRLVKAP